MSVSLPPKLPAINTVELRQKLAGLVDPNAEKEQWFDEVAKKLAVEFIAVLPHVFGQSLDRMTMWNKIPAAIQSAYAKTVSGNIDLFVNHVMESIQADPSQAVANESLSHSLESLQMLTTEQRQSWMTYVVTNLIPLCVYARKAYKEAIAK